MSIGIPRQWNHPRVKEAERHVIETTLRLGVALRVEIDTPDQERPYLDMGVRHFCMGWDAGILFDWLKENGAKGPRHDGSASMATTDGMVREALVRAAALATPMTTALLVAL